MKSYMANFAVERKLFRVVNLKQTAERSLHTLPAEPDSN